MEKSKPKASVVMPVHNGQKYIQEALESILAQRYPNLEIIVVDDASTDETGNIVKMITQKDNRVRYLKIDKKDNLGQVINEGIKISSGKYIVRMDSDDLMIEGRIEKQIEFLENNPDHVLVGGQLILIDQDSKEISKRRYPLDDSRLRKNLFLFQPFAHPAITIRKEALETIQLYPTDISKVEDLKLMFLLSKIGKFANLDIDVLKYRVTYNTQSQSSTIDHFRRTEDVRRWAIRELNIVPSFREKIFWNIEMILVYILSILPNYISVKVFEIGRRILK